MDRKKKNIIILICLVVVLILLGVIVCIELLSNSDFDSLLVNDRDNIKEENISYTEKQNVENNNQNKNDIKVNDDKNDNKNNDKINIKDSNRYSEDDVVSYFENIGNEVDNSSSFKEKFKKYFVDIVDFIFYDKEIKGYTFSELGNMAKIKIISIALKMDNKIEEYVPGYKESISSTSSKVYNNVKEKLVTIYLDISTDICSSDNEKECEKVKEIFVEVKDVCKISWDFIKSLVSNGVSKLREWYEIYSGK